MQRHWVEEATQRLAGLYSADEQAACHIQTAVEVGPPFVAIISYVRAHGVDLVVMGTHGRGAVRHLLLGSVAE